MCQYCIWHCLIKCPKCSAYMRQTFCFNIITTMAGTNRFCTRQQVNNGVPFVQHEKTTAKTLQFQRHISVLVLFTDCSKYFSVQTDANSHMNNLPTFRTILFFQETLSPKHNYTAVLYTFY